MALELVCGAKFWCNRHCRTSPVVLEGFWGQVWPKIGRKPAPKSEFRIANEPLRRVREREQNMQRAMQLFVRSASERSTSEANTATAKAADKREQITGGQDRQQDGELRCVATRIEKLGGQDVSNAVEHKAPRIS